MNWTYKTIVASPARGLLLAVLLGLSGCGERVQSDSDWSAAERGILTSISLQALAPRPASRSNRVADDAAAVELGRALFFEPRLSGAGDQSCASCHQPGRQFSDGRTTGQGVNALSRNTPTIIGGAWQTWFYWDGRRDSLWSQAIIPIEAPDEMAGSRLKTVQLIATDDRYRAHYEALFGPLPDALLTTDLPGHGGPITRGAGQDVWFGLDDARKRQVNQVYANVGKAIAAYERTLVPRASAFDRFMTALADGDEAMANEHLEPSAQAGARLFADIDKTGCLQCHNGALLTNGGFHNVGSGSFEGASLDFGRMLGVQAVQLDPFNCVGAFSDAPAEDCSALRFLAADDHGDTAGAFKVPTLRNVGQTAPYFHDGRFATLAQVIDHYNEPPVDQKHELKPLGLTRVEKEQLVAFLLSFDSPVYSEQGQ